jgi:PAS domain S-box-containing protein
MDWQYLLYMIPLLISAAISVGLAVYAWLRRPATAAIPFAGLMLAVAIWSFGYAMELASTGLTVKLFWARFQYLGIAAIPVAWLALAVEYTDQGRWLTLRNLALLSLVPLATLALVWTSGHHGLIWSEVGLETIDSLTILALTYGSWFWIQSAYAYALLLAGTILIARAFYQAPPAYRGQARVILIGALIPWLCNLFGLLSRGGHLPYVGLDPTPFGFTATGILVAWGLLRFQLLDIVPVARDAIVENMGDAVIVLNAQNRVVDLNRAAQEIFHLTETSAIGQPAGEVLAGLPDLAQCCQEPGEGQSEVLMQVGEVQRAYDLSITALRDSRGRLTGRLAVLHDVTERQKAEEGQRKALEDTLQATHALRESERFLQGMFDAIQDGLSVLDTDLTVTRVNQWMEQMYADQTPLVGQKCYALYQQRESPCPWCPALRTLETGKAHSTTVPYPSSDEPSGWIQLSAFPLKDSQGKVTAIIEYVQDITEQVEAAQVLQEQAEQLEALRQMSLELASQLDPDTLLQSIVSRAVELLGGTVGGLHLYRPDRNLLELAVVSGIDPSILGTTLHRGEGLAGRVWESGEAITVEDYKHWGSQAVVYETRDFGAMVGVPIRWGDESLGVLAVLSDKAGVFTVRHSELLTLLATQAALALQNARLFDEARRRNRELALLNRVIAASAASQEFELILDMVCRELARALDLPQAVAGLLNENKSKAVVVAEYQSQEWPSLVGREIVMTGHPVVQYLLEQETPLIVSNARDDPLMEPVAELVQARGIRSLLLLPLLFEGQSVGALVLASQEPRVFSPEAVDLARRVAEQVSGALARARLAQNQRRLSTAVEQAAEAVLITDMDATIVYVNPAFEKIVGQDRASFLGRRPDVFQHHRLDAPLHDGLLQAVTAGDIWQERLGYRAMDDNLRTLDLTVAPVRNQAEEIVNLVATIRDVTREVELEKQFQQSRKMEALGRLAGGIAHDFNNLLTVIQLSTHMLQRQLHPEDPLWAHSEQIRETGERATRLTRQLLRFSRRDVVAPRVLNLNKIVGDLSPTLQRIIGEEIELQTSLANELWPIMADPSQMDQVVINLAVNARDAMLHGGKLIIETANVVLDDAYTALQVDAKAGEHVLLSINDTGSGMDDDVKTHLFEPFFTTKGQGEGTGLGLATVFGIVKHSGGHIQVASELDQGTAFNIYLPRTEPAAPGAPRPDDPPHLRAPDLERSGTETVLVVEDEDAVRNQAVLVLRSYGYTVLDAAYGHAALDISRSHQEPIDLLLTDVIMPGMNGRELAELLQPERPDMRVLYTSGYTGDAIAHHGVQAESMAFLPKPFAPEDLLHKVRDVLDDRRGRPAGAGSGSRLRSRTAGIGRDRRNAALLSGDSRAKRDLRRGRLRDGLPFCLAVGDPGHVQPGLQHGAGHPYRGQWMGAARHLGGLGAHRL